MQIDFDPTIRRAILWNEGALRAFHAAALGGKSFSVHVRRSRRGEALSYSPPLWIGSRQRRPSPAAKAPGNSLLYRIIVTPKRPLTKAEAEALRHEALTRRSEGVL